MSFISTLTYFILCMCDVILDSLNLNRASADFKRATLFKQLKKTDIMFVQETHSTADKESD